MFDIPQPPRSPAPSLMGMERSVRSFKSFIKNTPPPSKSQYHKHKPLPPTPIYARAIFAMSSSSLPTTSDQPISASSWKAPATGEDPSMPDRLQAPIPQYTRSYAPLIPEPSPELFDRQQPGPWFPPRDSPQRSQLDRISDCAHVIPALPPRSSFRFSAFGTPSAGSDPSTPFLSPNLYKMKSPSNRGTPNSCPEPSRPESHDTSTSQSDVELRISNLSTKQRAFASLGIKNADQTDHWDNWPGGPGTPQFRDDVRTPLSVQHPQPQPSNLGHSVLDEELDIEDMSEKRRQLSVSQDYHDILADQYHEAHESESITHHEPGTESSNHAVNTNPQNGQELVPQPLSWSKKAYGSSSTGHSAPAMRTDPVSPSEPSPRHRRISSWVPVQQVANVFKRPSHDETNSRSSGSAVGSAHKRHSSHYSNPTSYLKSLGFTTKGTNSAGTDSPPMPLQPTPPPLSPQAEAPKQTFDPPSALTILPHLPASGLTPRLNTMSFLNISPTDSEDLTWPTSKLGFLNHDPNPTNYDANAGGWTRSSVYSQATVAPGVAVKRSVRTSVGSIGSTRTISNSSSSPTSPLAHEISFPRTPPPPPSYAPRMPDPNSPQSPASYGSVDRPFASRPVSEEFPKRPKETGIMEKAKGARKAWRRRQRKAKHEKLKASIRVLGPVDPTISDGFAMRVDRGLLHDGIDGSRAPEYMGGGAF